MFSRTDGLALRSIYLPATTQHPSLRGNYLHDVMPVLRPVSKTVMSPMFSFIVGLSPYMLVAIDVVLV